MSQTDDIHESFYDLFNQRFRRIDDPDPKRSPRYYTNIAIGPHLKPCRVDPKFSCIVVVKQTEVDTTPPPFLNRFEKYFISHEILLNTALNHLDPCVRIILQTAREKVRCFPQHSLFLIHSFPTTCRSMGSLNLLVKTIIIYMD